MIRPLLKLLQKKCRYLFTCYTKPLGAIARERRLSLHMYADDTQLYIAFKLVGGVSWLLSGLRPVSTI